MSFLRTSLVVLVFASISVLGCESTGESEIEVNEGSSEIIQGTRMPSLAKYYIARLDTRACAFPTCGGLFVSAVNQTVTQCPRGSYADECYVSKLDFSLWNGADDVAAQVEDALGFDLKRTRVVLLGTMQPAILGSGSLRVQMAWVALDIHDISGSFYNTRVNDLVCIAAPCPSYDQELLNRGEPVPFHGFDFDAVPPHGTDGTYTNPALHSLEGLIVSGENVRVENAGPAGAGTFLQASQVFIPVVVSGRNFRPMPRPAPAPVGLPVQ